MNQTRLDRERAEYSESAQRSRERRAKLRERRALERLLALPAVLGLIGLVYWITLPMPVERWWIALGSAFLLIPYWTIRYGLEED